MGEECLAQSLATAVTGMSMKTAAGLEPGETVLIQGATGVAGRVAVKVARLRSDDALREVAGLGADMVISTAVPDDQLAEAFTAARGDGYDVVLDFLWGRPTEILLRTLVPSSFAFGKPTRLIGVGESAGPAAARPQSRWPLCCPWATCPLILSSGVVLLICAFIAIQALTVPMTAAVRVRGTSSMPQEAAGRDRRRYLDVAEQILRAAAAGTITRGDRLPNERDLAARCRVSRSTVREALLALELGGVIEVRPGSGCYLTGLGILSDTSPPALLDSSPRDLIEARRIIEPQVARTCAWRIRPGDVRRLELLVDDAERMSADPPPEGLDPFVHLTLAFHRELASLSGNAILAGLMSHLVDTGAHPLWLLVDGIAVRNPATRAAQIKEHRDILAAVAGHRGDDAEQAMARHLGALTRRIFGMAGSRRPGSGAGLA